MVGELHADKIVLAGIQFRGHHGDSEAERTVGGRFEVDVIVAFDTRKAEMSDALADTIDYYAMHKRILEIGQRERHQLLERLAGRIATVLLTEFAVAEVTVKVRKLMPPLEGIVAYSGVEITRKRSNG